MQGEGVFSWKDQGNFLAEGVIEMGLDYTSWKALPIYNDTA
jgi:hypothetical protein